MPIRSSIRRAPYRNFNEVALSDTDKVLARDLEGIFSRGNLGLNLLSVSTTASLDADDAFILADATSGAFTITLAPANTWGSGKTPIITIQNIGTANDVTVAAAGSDTINGAASVTIAPGGAVTLGSDGSTKYYILGNGDMSFSPILRVPTVTIDAGGTAVAATAARIPSLFLPNATTTTSASLQTAVSYTGSGVLEGVVVENSVGTASAFNLKITIDGVVIWNSATTLSAVDTMRAIVGQITQTTSDAVYHFIPDPVAVPFKTSCLIEFASTTAGQQVGIGWKIAKKS